MNKKLMALLIGGLFTAQTGLTHAAENRVVSYLTMWTSYSATELSEKLPVSKTDTFLLSFGEWSADGSVTFSENALTPPEWDAYYLPTPYVSWTTLKHDHPDKKVMVAFGGQTYESIWSHLDNPEQREKIAQSLASLLEKPFPVYKKNLKLTEVVGECHQMEWESSCNLNNYQYAGDVYLDGIDFDFEKANRLTETENQNLLALVSRLRELVGNKKLLSLTTYHVGADPENCANPSVMEQCSYIEPSRSSHHGEVTNLLKKSSKLFDFFNVMTYDAGKNFRYQVAMENYAKAIGDKSKVLVGATINQQWGPEGPFVETEENNLERASWQAKNGYGGIFVWALGQSTQNLPLTTQAEYVGRLADAAASALQEENKPGGETEGNISESIALTVPDVTQGPVLSWVDYQKGGEIRLYTTDQDMQDHYTVKLNGNYVYSVDGGTAYYSYKVENDDNVNTIIHQFTPDEFKPGDLLTLHKEGHADALQTITIGDDVRYSDDDAVVAVSALANSEKVTVTLNKALYSKANRYIVLLNGNYLMESFAGNAYYASVNREATGGVELSTSARIKAGDKIEVLRASGKPGVQGYSTSVIHTAYATAGN
ncbi:glycoside hydrolase family 18 protein [Erwinia sp. PK3-005]